MPDIPGTAPSFPDLEDNVDFVEAEDQNNPNDEIEALSTYVGMIGSGLTQADSIDLLEMFRKARQSFVLKWTDADTIQASVGEIVCTNSGDTQRVPRKNTSTTNITFADIDTGARAADTTYYVFAVADATANTVTFVVSIDVADPTGITRRGLVGKFATNSANDIIESSVVSFVGEVVVQTKHLQDGAAATGTALTPLDNTSFQSDEGDLYMELPFLPTDALNRLEIGVVFNGAISFSGTMMVGLFQNAVIDTIACAAANNGGVNNALMNVNFTHNMLAGTTDLITFKVLAGPNGAYTLTFNGKAGSGLFQGLMASSIVVREYRKVYA